MCTKLNITSLNEIETPRKIVSSSHAQADASSGNPSRSVGRPGAVEKIRSELNIEKWPAIWQPSKSKNRPALRTMEREISLDGTRIKSRVEVGYTQLGTLSTEEQKLLYVLIKLWEDEGKPEAQVFFSTRGLARMLKKKGWGTNVIEATTKSLRKLRTVPIEWINSYRDQTDSGGVLVDRRPFTILGDLRIVERRQDGAVNSSLGYFKFDDHILRNLQLNYTKPVCIEEFFKLKSEIAQLVYSHVDLMLFDKSRYERRTQELFQDLGLKNAEYSHMYERRRALEKGLGELEGIRLSKGSIKSATIEKTKDGKDYKVVFVKTSARDGDSFADEVVALEPAPAVVINRYSGQPDPVLVEAQELVRYFHKTFHNLDSHAPQSKETAQALSLISQHGLGAAKTVVDFAQVEAAKTRYSIQHFGAVLSYASRALAAADRRRVHARPSQPARTKVVPQERRHEKGERRLALISSSEFQRRHEYAEADLFRERPFLAATRSKGSGLVERTIRTRIVRELEDEVMDLMLIDMTMTSRYPWLIKPAQNLPL